MLLKKIIKKNIAYIEIDNLKSNNNIIELCGIKLTNFKDSIVILDCYKPPTSSCSQEEWDELFNNIDDNSKALIVGDFNAHNQAWNCNYNSTDGSRILNSINNKNLFLNNSNT